MTLLMRGRLLILTAWASAVLWGTALGSSPANAIMAATITASSRAGAADGKYGTERLRDGDRGTHWASGTHAAMPQWVRAEWGKPVTIDTVHVDVFARRQPNIYAQWREFEVRLSHGAVLRRGLAIDDEEFVVLRLDGPRSVTWAEVRMLSVHEPKHYVGITELGFYLDPQRRVRPPRRVVSAKARAELEPQGRPAHPTVYVTQAQVLRARRNAEQTEWGRTEKASILKQAATWLAHDEEHWLRFLPPPGSCYAYGFSGCPICGSRWGTWAGARCKWDLPGKVTCRRGHVLPDAEHPDDGAGYVAKDRRIHYFVGSWNAWVTEQWTLRALPSLAHAYALTAEEKYADRAAFFIDALASVYAESTSGSWDYPSRPPSGRFARPWYQVARNLVVFVEAYDLIYSSPALDQPSLRPRLERTFPPGPTLQKRVVGTKDAKGKSWPAMTRRENVDTNLMQDAGYYCYSKTFKGVLHNGHADYMRGALAVGALLGIPEYVQHAVESPFSIRAMLANNCDRDGRYYETALGYALHARNLYLTFVEPLRYWRSPRYPRGVDLFADPRMRSFYYLPDLVMQCAGHAPNFGDAGPDNRFAFQQAHPHSVLDYRYAEWLQAGCTGEAKQGFAAILRFLAKGDVPKARLESRVRRWLLYNAEPMAADRAEALDPDLERRIFGSWFLGQKGIAILRDGQETDAQAVLLRYGPSLNHGDFDDLGLIYYGRGWQLTYEIGYGLATTHCQRGWASQTAAHTIVTVNEKTQTGRGTGGSLRLFAVLPSVKIMEADSPLSYERLGVTEYRRTVALVGQGSDQYLVDLFRVKGGQQHDYGIGVQGDAAQPDGLDLGPEEEGSLAGPEIDWGSKIGMDGDVIGVPNRPGWNPPPGNGYGFLHSARRGTPAGPFRVDFDLGGRNMAHLRVHGLPEADTEAIVAQAPGLYPHNRKATFLLSRRRATGAATLSSAFASVLESYAREVATEGVPWSELAEKLVERRGEVKPIPGLGIFLLKGKRGGDFMTFALDIERAGDYEVAAQILQAPSYGAVKLVVDDAALGEPFAAQRDTVAGPTRVSFGRRRLSRGRHRFRFEMVPATAYYVGLSSVIVLPWEERPAPGAARPRPVLSAARRVPVQAEDSGEMTPVGVHTVRGGRDEYFFSAALSDAPRRAATSAGPITWRGAALFVACRGGRVESLAGHAAWDVRIAGRRYGPDTGLWAGRVTALSYEQRWVEVTPRLPAGLSGRGVYFSNPKYSRNTAYRIYRVTPTRGGTRIDLGPQPMLLGRGRVHEITVDGDMLTDIPHDYARARIGGPNSRFFDGKRVTNARGAATNLRSVIFGSPMQLKVESVEGFVEGDPLYYYDLQVGDAAAVACEWETAFDAQGRPRQRR